MIGETLYSTVRGENVDTPATFITRDIQLAAYLRVHLRVEPLTHYSRFNPEFEFDSPRIDKTLVLNFYAGKACNVSPKHLFESLDYLTGALRRVKSG